MDATKLDRALLLDFYGDLLTEKQRRFWELHWCEDLSLAEISELEGLSRQGVWDILRRAEANLREIETKTGVVRRYLDRREEIRSIRAALVPLLPDDERGRDILRRLDELMR